MNKMRLEGRRPDKQTITISNLGLILRRHHLSSHFIPKGGVGPGRGGGAGGGEVSQEEAIERE